MFRRIEGDGGKDSYTNGTQPHGNPAYKATKTLCTIGEDFASRRRTKAFRLAMDQCELEKLKLAPTMPGAKSENGTVSKLCYKKARQRCLEILEDLLSYQNHGSLAIDEEELEDGFQIINV